MPDTYNGHLRVAAFISIPKNASKTVLHMLRLGKNRDRDTTSSPVIYENHQRGAVLADKCRLDRLYTFCFVRDPYERCISWYEYHRNLQPYESLTFADWVHAGMPHHWKRQNQTDYEARGLTPLLQTTFVDGCRPDFIGRIESFDADMQRLIVELNSLCEQHDLPRRFEYEPCKLNTRERSGPLDDYCSDEVKQAIYRQLKPDFTTFGYRP